MKSPANHKFPGFSLVELMIAMVVTLLLLYGAMMVFKDAATSNQMVTQASDMTDNLRAGLNMIQLDLQQAGEGIPIGGIPIPYTSNGSSTAPCGTTLPPNRPALLSGATFPPCNAVMPSIEPGQALGPLITAPDAVAGNPSNPNSYTDEVTMLYADNTSGIEKDPVNKPATPGPPASPACNGTLVLSGTLLTVTFDVNCVDLSKAGVPVQPGDLVMFSNSLGSTLMAVTSVNGQIVYFASNDAFNLNGRTDPSGTINQLQSAGVFPPTLATRVWMISYYLDNISSPPYIRLIRQVNFNPPTPVGETLENLQFTYNFVDGVNNPSNQPSVPNGNSETQIRSVNVYLGARSSYMVKQGSKEVYARNNLVTQVSLRSMAYYNKYQ